MKLMIRLLPVVMILLLLSSCSKNSGSSGTQYYIKAAINGTQLNNSGYSVASFSESPTQGIYTCTIQGSSSATATTNLVSIVIADKSAITTKTYTTEMIDGISQATVNYTDANGTLYSSLYSSTKDAVVSISTLNSSDVAGSFSGTLSNATGTASVAVSNGVFVVKRLY